MLVLSQLHNEQPTLMGTSVPELLANFGWDSLYSDTASTKIDSVHKLCAIDQRPSRLKLTAFGY